MERKDEILHNLFGDNDGFVQEHFDRLEAIQKKGKEHWTQVLSDMMYRTYTDALAKKLSVDRNRVWNYSFEYGNAYHAAGFTYLQHVLKSPGEEVSETEMMERRKVSRAMRWAIRRFITTGIPEEPQRWPEYQSSSGYVKMIFDAVPHTESCPRHSLDKYPEMVYVRHEEVKI